MRIRVLIFSTLTVLILLYSVNKSYDSEFAITNGDRKYQKIYSVLLKKKIIGYCTQNHSKYICEIYLKNKNRKFSYKIKMRREGNLIIYSSPSVSFKKKINPSNLIYPFLFNESNDKIYYPESSVFVEKKYLKIKKIENGYYAPPFKYIKVNKVPQKINYLDVMKFRRVNSKIIKKEYPIKYIISFNSEMLPPSSLRQKCLRKNNYIECELTNNNIIKKNSNDIKENISWKNSSSLKQFIDKYNLKKYKNNENLIPKLIDALHKEIKYNDISQKMTTEEILKSKKGDCTEFSQVSVSVLKSLGISSRRIYGLIFKAKRGVWLYHSWVEYLDDKTILAFDPVNKKAFIDLNYLKLGVENKYGITIISLDIDDIKFENVF